MIAAKGNKMHSILHNKCPRCHEGDFFKQNNPYHPTQSTKMNDGCSVCGQHYEPEPGFFYGAMYVSYAFNIAWFVTAWVATSVIIAEERVWLRLSIMLAINFIMYPLTYRLSRLVYINLFVKYDGKQGSRNNQLSTNINSVLHEKEHGL